MGEGGAFVGGVETEVGEELVDAAAGGQLLAGFAFSGFGAYILGRRLTGSWIAGLAAGVFYAFVPFRFTHLAHIQHIWGHSTPNSMAPLRPGVPSLFFWTPVRPRSRTPHLKGRRAPVRALFARSGSFDSRACERGWARSARPAS